MGDNGIFLGESRAVVVRCTIYNYDKRTKEQSANLPVAAPARRNPYRNQSLSPHSSGKTTCPKTKIMGSQRRV